MPAKSTIERLGSVLDWLGRIGGVWTLLPSSVKALFGTMLALIAPFLAYLQRLPWVVVYVSGLFTLCVVLWLFRFLNQNVGKARKVSPDGLPAPPSLRPPRDVHYSCRQRIKVGDYHEHTFRGREIRIEVREIKIEPPRTSGSSLLTLTGSVEREKELARVKVTWGGALVHPAQHVKEIGTNEFLMPKAEYEEDQYSAYSFWDAGGSVWLFALWVSHINSKAQEVDIEITASVNKY